MNESVSGQACSSFWTVGDYPGGTANSPDAIAPFERNLAGFLPCKFATLTFETLLISTQKNKIQILELESYFRDRGQCPGPTRKAGHGLRRGFGSAKKPSEIIDIGVNFGGALWSARALELVRSLQTRAPTSSTILGWMGRLVPTTRRLRGECSHKRLMTRGRTFPTNRPWRFSIVLCADDGRQNARTVTAPPETFRHDVFPGSESLHPQRGEVGAAAKP